MHIGKVAPNNPTQALRVAEQRISGSASLHPYCYATSDIPNAIRNINNFFSFSIKMNWEFTLE